MFNLFQNNTIRASLDLVQKAFWATLKYGFWATLKIWILDAYCSEFFADRN